MPKRMPEAIADGASSVKLKIEETDRAIEKERRNRLGFKLQFRTLYMAVPTFNGIAEIGKSP
jgi:hypothetical protein